MDCKKLGFASRQIHAGKESNTAGALVTPIYQTSTFEFDSVFNRLFEYSKTAD